MRRLLQVRRDVFYLIVLPVALSPILVVIAYILSLFLNIEIEQLMSEIRLEVFILYSILVILLYYKYLKYHRTILNIIVIPVSILLILAFLTFIFPQQRSPEYYKCREALVTLFGKDGWSSEVSSPKFNEILQKCHAIK